MPYRFKTSDKSVKASLRRIADEQIGKALGEIADTDLPLGDKVHQVRKRCKKIRGLLRLVRPAFDDYSGENAAFRDAARQLSGLRDKDSLVETFDALLDHFDNQTNGEVFALIRARLAGDAKQIRHEADTAVKIETARRALTKARARAKDWTLDEGGFDAIEGGLRKTYKRARKSMEAAFEDPTAEAMHEWRKRVKYHWYHSRLLGPINPAMMAPREAMADELSDILGDHHDLAVLEERLDDAAKALGSEKDRDAFRALLDRRKQDLTARAFELGRILLAEKSKALTKRWEGYWEAWQSGKGPDGLVVEG